MMNHLIIKMLKKPKEEGNNFCKIKKNHITHKLYYVFQREVVLIIRKNLRKNKVKQTIIS